MAALGIEDGPVLQADGELVQNWDFEIAGLGDRVKEKLRSKQQLSEAEVEQLNETLRADVRETFARLADQVTDAIKIRKEDDPNLTEVKLNVAGLYIAFFAKVTRWLADKLKTIISQITRFFEWCWQKTEELFQYLRNKLNTRPAVE